MNHEISYLYYLYYTYFMDVMLFLKNDVYNSRSYIPDLDLLRVLLITPCIPIRIIKGILPKSDTKAKNTVLLVLLQVS